MPEICHTMTDPPRANARKTRAYRWCLGSTRLTVPSPERSESKASGRRLEWAVASRSQHWRNEVNHRPPGRQSTTPYRRPTHTVRLRISAPEHGASADHHAAGAPWGATTSRLTRPRVARAAHSRCDSKGAQAASRRRHDGGAPHRRLGTWLTAPSARSQYPLCERRHPSLATPCRLASRDHLEQPWSRSTTPSGTRKFRQKRAPPSDADERLA